MGSDHREHPGYVLLEASDVHALTDAVKGLTRVMSLRVEKVERDQLLELRNIAKSQAAMHDDLREFLARFDLMMQTLVKKMANGAAHEDPGDEHL